MPECILVSFPGPLYSKSRSRIAFQSPAKTIDQQHISTLNIAELLDFNLSYSKKLTIEPCSSSVVLLKLEKHAKDTDNLLPYRRMCVCKQEPSQNKAATIWGELSDVKSEEEIF